MEYQSSQKKLGSIFSYAAAFLFAALTVLLNIVPQSIIVVFLAILIHFILFPVVSILPSPEWARISGYAWLVIDNTASVMLLNGVEEQLAMSIRLGGHIFAAVWIIAVSLKSNTAMKTIGFLLSVVLGGYSLVAPWVPVWMLYPSMLLLVVWFILYGRSISLSK